MKTKDYGPDERPALTLTRKGTKAASFASVARSYEITEMGLSAMNQPLPMDAYPVIKMAGAK